MLLPIIAATAALIAPAPFADPAVDAVHRVFSCDIGSRMLTVERTGGELHYRFANSSRVEVSLDASVARGNLFRQQGAGDGQQALRFANERHSYVIYTDGEADSGVIIFDGERQVARLHCRNAMPIDLSGLDPAHLPDDAAAYSAFAH